MDDLDTHKKEKFQLIQKKIDLLRSDLEAKLGTFAQDLLHEFQQ